MSQPDWASDLLLKVLDIEGRSKLPKVQWRKSRSNWTTGRYYRYSKRVVVSIGTDGHEKQVLIHELSHWLTRGRGHHKRFWIKCFDLLKKLDLLTEEYKQREFQYMKKASYVYNLMTEGGEKA